MGDLAEEIAARNTELLGTEVIPHLRDIWADQPDHWTPLVSPGAGRNARAPRRRGVRRLPGRQAARRASYGASSRA